MTRRADASVVMVLSREGRLAHPSVCSVLKAMDAAEAAGVRSEMMLVLDRPDEATKRYGGRFQRHAQVQCVTVGYNDLGRARNEGVARSEGQWITVMTPMHRICFNWIVDAVRMLSAAGARRIARPEYLVVLGAKCWAQHLIGSDDPAFPKEALLVDSVYRTGCCCAAKTVFETTAYPSSADRIGRDTIDWYFSCETLAGGIGHVAVPGTALFVSDPEGDAVENRAAESCTPLLRKSGLFDPDIWKSVVG